MKSFIKKILGVYRVIVLVVLLIPVFGSCTDKEGVRIDIIEFDKEYAVFTQAGGTETIAVKTTAPNSRLTASVLNSTWCSAVIEKGMLVVTVVPNENTLSRHAVVKVMGDRVIQTLSVTQDGRNLTLTESDKQFDYLTIFTDQSCSTIKAGVTETQINAIPSAFFRALALEIYNGNYDTEFRIQNYKPWQRPEIMATKNKTRKYSKRDNPTGIFALKNEQIVFFMGTKPTSAVINVALQDPDNNIEGTMHTAVPGLNTFTAPYSGLIYIEYFTTNADEAPVTINFATCSVNGYFDIAKHQPDEWTKRLNKAEFRHFDLLGERSHLTFETEMFRNYTSDGAELAKTYDQIVYLQQDFMGLFKYGREFNNRVYFIVSDNDMHMYATDYYTGYSPGTQADILDIEKIKTTAVWGPAHEVGHVNQTRPGLVWRGMTEVTNNIFSMAVQTQFGNRSRLLTDYPNYYQVAKKAIIDEGIAHNAISDAFCKLVPFWQLKLYLVDALGQEDFYRDLFEQIRVRPNPATDGDAQLNFVKLACEISHLDLTDFFEAWGFLTPVNIIINDYGDAQFTVTQVMIDVAKAEIAAMKLPKPTHNDIWNITDENINLYQ